MWRLIEAEIANMPTSGHLLVVLSVITDLYPHNIEMWSVMQC